MYKTILLNIIIFLFFSCAARQNIQNVHVVTPDGKYDSEFPNRPTAKYLKNITASVKIVSSLIFYKKYFFDPELKITSESLRKDDFKDKAFSTAIIEKPASGTATIIYADQRKIGLLTCAHIVTKPDTVIYYIQDANGNPTEYIESVSLKVRQSLNVIGLPRGGEIKIIAVDVDADLAFLGKSLHIQSGTPPIVFMYPWGSAKELDWGDFVYHIGFPHGKKMVINSIISNPYDSKRNNYIINATLYPGASGGIVLAIRDGVPNFELVGISNALSAKHTLKLKPEPYINIKTINPTQSYSGKLYLERDVNIISGITFVIPVETIQQFLDENKDKLARNGYYDLGSFK